MIFSKKAAPALSDTALALVTALVLALQASLTLQTLHEAKEASSRAQEAAVLDERNRIAREIHDTLAQSFTGVATHLEAARALVPQDSKAQFHIEQARSAAREGLQEARRSVRALRPHSLEGSNLCAALRTMVAHCDHTEPPHVEFSVEGEPFPLPSEVEDGLLRVGQEALINAVRHAQAQEVAVELVFSPLQVLLRVRDDGQGFDPDSGPEPSGFGLVGIRERAGRMNGRLSLSSAPGQGTELVVMVPAAQEAA